MASSKAFMRIDNAAFLALSRQYLRRSGIAATINKRETFNLLPKAPPSIDSVPIRDLDVFNSPVNKLFAQPYLGKSIVEAYLVAGPGKDVEDDDDDDVDDFVDDDDDSCDDEDYSDYSDEDEDVGGGRRPRV